MPDQPTARFAQLRDVRLQYYECGAGPLVILLHGFPEIWMTWAAIMQTLAGSGYRVVAPNMRGYGESARPAGISAYRPHLLAQDIVELIEHCGASEATIVGHDWGGIVAWFAAALHPARVRSVCTLAAPHPWHWSRMRRDPAQLWRSWYVFLFQIPHLPEAIARHDNFGGLRRVLCNDPSRAVAPEPEFVNACIDAARLGTSGTFNYYRALIRGRCFESGAKLPAITCPTLTIWGKQDRALCAKYAVPPPGAAAHCRCIVLDDVGHWIPGDAAQVVEHELSSLLKSSWA